MDLSNLPGIAQALRARGQNRMVAMPTGAPAPQMAAPPMQKYAPPMQPRPVPGVAMPNAPQPPGNFTPMQPQSTSPMGYTPRPVPQGVRPQRAPLGAFNQLRMM